MRAVRARQIHLTLCCGRACSDDLTAFSSLSPGYERGRDAVLRFFVRYTTPFMWIAGVLVAIFIVDILVIIVFFWGAVFGVRRASSHAALQRRPPGPSAAATRPSSSSSQLALHHAG